MPAPSPAVDRLPASARAALRQLGADLQIARKRRGESLRAWAERLGVSVPTLRRLEMGDPAVGIGVVATALFLVGRHKALADIAAPQLDTAALDAEVANLGRKRVRAARGAHG